MPLRMHSADSAASAKTTPVSQNLHGERRTASGEYGCPREGLWVVLQVLRLTGPAVGAGQPLASLLARCRGLQELDLRGSAVSLDTWLAGMLEQHGRDLRVLRVWLARHAWRFAACREL